MDHKITHIFDLRDRRRHEGQDVAELEVWPFEDELAHHRGSLRGQGDVLVQPDGVVRLR